MQFIDLAAQQTRIREQIEKNVNAVLNHGKYIMGPEVGELEGLTGKLCRRQTRNFMRFGNRCTVTGINGL